MFEIRWLSEEHLYTKMQLTSLRINESNLCSSFVYLEYGEFRPLMLSLLP